MRNAILFAPALMFVAGMSVSYGLFVPNPNMLWAFIYIIPLGIGVAFIASAEAELDRAAKKQTGASREPALAGSGEK